MRYLCQCDITDPSVAKARELLISAGKQPLSLCQNEIRNEGCFFSWLYRLTSNFYKADGRSPCSGRLFIEQEERSLSRKKVKTINGTGMALILLLVIVVSGTPEGERSRVKMSEAMELLEILKQEVTTAVGCTEPGAIAFAAATAAAHCQGELVEVEVLLSPGVFKNGYAVGIPGTGAKGIPLAAALGALIKEPEKELAILKDLGQEQIEAAKKLVRQRKIAVKYDWDLDGIYVQIRLRTTEDKCIVIVKGAHTRVESVVLNGQPVFLSQGRLQAISRQKQLRALGLKNLIFKAQELPVAELEFLLEGLEQNYKIAEAGLKDKTGVGVGYGISNLMKEKIIRHDLINETRCLVAAAADARMQGSHLPVSTSFGSGNQGILTFLAIGEAAKYLKASEEQLLHALAIGHLVNGYVKEVTGKISPLCGCAIAAGLGVTVAVSWLLGNSLAGIKGAVNNLLGNITGMVCDGAKGGCSFKLATSAGEALMAAFLAKREIAIKEPEGIVAGDIEDSIANLGLIGKVGMSNLDRTMLSIVTEEQHKLA